MKLDTENHLSMCWEFSWLVGVSNNADYDAGYGYWPAVDKGYEGFSFEDPWLPELLCVEERDADIL